jgi:cell division septum initiation protein DivIVA
MEQREKDLEKKIIDLNGENAWLRENNDKMVEQLDQAQSEIQRLKDEIARLEEEIERLKAELESLRGVAQSNEEELERLRSGAQSDQDALRRDLEAAQAEAASLRERLAQGEALAQELNNASQENDELREKAKKGEQHYQDLYEARRENDQLKQQLEELMRFKSNAVEAEQKQRAQAQQELEAARAEVERLRVEASNAKADELLEEVPIPMVVPVGDDPPPEPAEAVEVAEPAQPAEPASAPKVPFTGKAGKGLDIGTVNLVSAEQNNEGETELRLQRNVFIDVEVTPYTKAMLTKLDVGYVVQNKRMYILGEPAFKLANVLNRRTRRPMADGLISPKEQDALPIMKLLIGSILGDPRSTSEVCFYSVPGDPVDSDLSVAYHRDLFDAVLKSLGYKPSHILEGHAVTFAELAEEDFTGIGISCGGGMFNVCVAYKSMPALSFSTARSGDWVDRNVAQALGIKPEKAAQLKEKGVDLMAPKNREEDAISIYYRNLVQYNISNIAERFRSADNMPSFKEPISIVFSGGTSMAGNFIELVKDVFSKIEFPLPVKEVRMAKDPLNATAKGALVAAQLEMANQPQ